MTKSARPLLVALFATSLLIACNPDEPEPEVTMPDVGPSAYFAPDVDHPERSLIPLPNILALDDSTDPPRLSLTASNCFEPGSATERTLQALEDLDGFSTFAAGAIQATFSAPLSDESLEGRVLLFDLGPFGQDAPGAPGEPLPVVTLQTTSPKYLLGCDAEPAMVPTLVILPMDAGTGLPVVLEGDHQYAIALLAGIMDDQGRRVRPYFIFNRIRAEEPIEPDMSNGAAFLNSMALAQLQELHRPVLDALQTMGHPRDEILVAWTFNTQTTDGALARIASDLGSFGPALDATDVSVPADGMPVPPLPAAQFLAAIGQSCDAIGAGPDCPGLDLLLTGQFVSPRFQRRAPLPAGYTSLDSREVFVPGTFDSAVHPSPQGADVVPFLAATPAGAAGPTPVVIMVHPLPPTDPVRAASANKLSALALANAFGSAGMATVAIDLPLSGDRAILVHDLVDDADELYPVLSADGLATRDTLRQGAVDLLQLVRVIRDCTPATCGGLDPDPDRIYLVGTSMGALVAALMLPHTDRISRAVLNAPAAGLSEVLSSSPVLLSELAPTLCMGGVVSAACCADNPKTCTPEDLATDPGFTQFKLSIQWMLDPADPVITAGSLGAQVAAGDKRLLVQLAQGDVVFGSAAGSLLGGLLGLDADSVRAYDPGEICGAVPGGAHAMLLQNCGTGTAQMVQDIIGFLLAP